MECYTRSSMDLAIDEFIAVLLGQGSIARFKGYWRCDPERYVSPPCSFLSSQLPGSHEVSFLDTIDPPFYRDVSALDPANYGVNTLNHEPHGTSPLLYGGQEWLPGWVSDQYTVWHC